MADFSRPRYASKLSTGSCWFRFCVSSATRNRERGRASMVRNKVRMRDGMVQLERGTEARPVKTRGSWHGLSNRGVAHALD